MGERDNKHFQIAQGAIEKIDAAVDAGEVGQIVHQAAALFGFEHFCCAMPGSFIRPAFEAGVLMHRWPKAWSDAYRAADFHLHDPVLKHTRSQLESFYWWQAPTSDNAAARSVMISAAEFGLRRGICIPMHSLDGYQASVSFAGYEIEESSKSKAAVELIAIYAFNKLSRFRAEHRSAEKVLTARQREILSWTAVGKTARDIGQILQISPETVNKLTASAIALLNASNRTHAVVEAIRRREVIL